jgi:hypothetical protein
VLNSLGVVGNVAGRGPARHYVESGRALLMGPGAWRESGAVTMVIDSDPSASGFYRRMGAVDDAVARSGSVGEDLFRG